MESQQLHQTPLLSQLGSYISFTFPASCQSVCKLQDLKRVNEKTRKKKYLSQAQGTIPS